MIIIQGNEPSIHDNFCAIGHNKTMNDLFMKTSTQGVSNQQKRPLADMLRPNSFDAVYGQDHIVGEQGALRQLLESGHVPSLILWGPPGCGKTTIARLITRGDGYVFKQISAIFSGVADLKKIFEEARFLKEQGKQMVLFVDEIHRFNKSQQDSFLPVIEDGTIVLIGATTENPSFELNGALLSRCQLFTLKRLNEEALENLIRKALDETDSDLELPQDVIDFMVNQADGDGRFLLSMVETLLKHPWADKTLTVKAIEPVLNKRAPLYDKSSEGHYNLISALHKSVRGSDPDAALYWFARMLDGGEDPRYLARRIIRMANEDVGLADPEAVKQAVTAADIYERLGSPEGELALAQALVYIATAPKSNAVYMAYKKARVMAKETGSLMPPKHILNAPTKMMKNEGYGDGYLYDHDQPDAFSGQDYFPAEMGRQKIYEPVKRGFERDIEKRLEYWQQLRTQKNKGK